MEIIFGCIVLFACIAFVALMGKMNVYDQATEDEEELNYLKEWYQSRNL